MPKAAPLQPVKPEPMDDFLPARKPAPIQTVKPVEICAQCGGPIINKNRVFCENCGVNIREELSGGVSSMVKHPVLNPRISTPVIHKNTEDRTIKKQESVLVQGSGELLQPKTRKLIVILAMDSNNHHYAAPGVHADVNLVGITLLIKGSDVFNAEYRI